MFEANSVQWSGWLLKLNKKLFPRTKRYFVLSDYALYCLSKKEDGLELDLIKKACRWFVDLYKYTHATIENTDSVRLHSSLDPSEDLQLQADEKEQCHGFVSVLNEKLRVLHSAPVASARPGAWAHGLLFKVAAVWKTPRLRYFRIQRGEIEYFREWDFLFNDEKSPPAGRIPLSGAWAESLDETRVRSISSGPLLGFMQSSRRGYPFQLVFLQSSLNEKDEGEDCLEEGYSSKSANRIPSQRSIVLIAATEKERETWVAIIRLISQWGLDSQIQLLKFELRTNMHSVVKTRALLEQENEKTKMEYPDVVGEIERRNEALMDGKLQFIVRLSKIEGSKFGGLFRNYFSYPVRRQTIENMKGDFEQDQTEASRSSEMLAASSKSPPIKQFQKIMEKPWFVCVQGNVIELSQIEVVNFEPMKKAVQQLLSNQQSETYGDAWNTIDKSYCFNIFGDEVENVEEVAELDSLTKLCLTWTRKASDSLAAKLGLEKGDDSSIIAFSTFEAPILSASIIHCVHTAWKIRVEMTQAYREMREFIDAGCDESWLLQILQQSWHDLEVKEEVPSSVIDKRWAVLGFQRDDPRSDFRAQGSLAVMLFSSLCSVSARMSGMVASKRDYPLFCAVMNITAGLLDEIGEATKPPPAFIQHKLKTDALGGPLFELLCRDAHNKAALDVASQGGGMMRSPFFLAFVDLLSVYVELMDTRWIRIDATYMQFPEVLRWTRAEMKCVIEAAPPSIHDVRQIIFHRYPHPHTK